MEQVLNLPTAVSTTSHIFISSAKTCSEHLFPSLINNTSAVFDLSNPLLSLPPVVPTANRYTVSSSSSSIIPNQVKSMPSKVERNFECNNNNNIYNKINYKAMATVSSSELSAPSATMNAKRKHTEHLSNGQALRGDDEAMVLLAKSEDDEQQPLLKKTKLALTKCHNDGNNNQAKVTLDKESKANKTLIKTKAYDRQSVIEEEEENKAENEVQTENEEDLRTLNNDNQMDQIKKLVNDQNGRGIYSEPIVSTTTLTSYEEKLKKNLLDMLRKLIPHKRCLQVRMLIHFSVDECQSESIVVDETLWTSSKCNHEYDSNNDGSEQLKTAERQANLSNMQAQCVKTVTTKKDYETSIVGSEPNSQIGQNAKMLKSNDNENTTKSKTDNLQEINCKTSTLSTTSSLSFDALDLTVGQRSTIHEDSRDETEQIISIPKSSDSSTEARISNLSTMLTNSSNLINGLTLPTYVLPEKTDAANTLSLLQNLLANPKIAANSKSLFQEIGPVQSMNFLNAFNINTTNDNNQQTGKTGNPDTNESSVVSSINQIKNAFTSINSNILSKSSDTADNTQVSTHLPPCLSAEQIKALATLFSYGPTNTKDATNSSSNNNNNNYYSASITSTGTQSTFDVNIRQPKGLSSISNLTSVMPAENLLSQLAASGLLNSHLNETNLNISPSFIGALSPQLNTAKIPQINNPSLNMIPSELFALASIPAIRTNDIDGNIEETNVSKAQVSNFGGQMSTFNTTDSTNSTITASETFGLPNFRKNFLTQSFDNPYNELGININPLVVAAAIQETGYVSSLSNSQEFYSKLNAAFANATANNNFSLLLNNSSNPINAQQQSDDNKSNVNPTSKSTSLPTESASQTSLQLQSSSDIASNQLINQGLQVKSLPFLGSLLTNNLAKRSLAIPFPTVAPNASTLNFTLPLSNLSMPNTVVNNTLNPIPLSLCSPLSSGLQSTLAASMLQTEANTISSSTEKNNNTSHSTAQTSTPSKMRFTTNNSNTNNSFNIGGISTTNNVGLGAAAVLASNRLSMGESVWQINQADDVGVGNSGIYPLLNYDSRAQSVLKQSNLFNGAVGDLFSSAAVVTCTGNSSEMSINRFDNNNNNLINEAEQSGLSEKVSDISQVISSVNMKRIHPNRRFMCNQCRNQFNSLADLNRHTMEKHNSFRCTICNAKFTQRSNLQRHSLKHIGFRPFLCNICKKEYYRKDHLVRHIEVTHPTVDPKANITVRLTSSECLDYLDKLKDKIECDEQFEGTVYEDDPNLPGVQNEIVNSSVGCPVQALIEIGERFKDPFETDKKIAPDKKCPANNVSYCGSPRPADDEKNEETMKTETVQENDPTSEAVSRTQKLHNNDDDDDIDIDDGDIDEEESNILEQLTNSDASNKSNFVESTIASLQFKPLNTTSHSENTNAEN